MKKAKSKISNYFSRGHERSNIAKKNITASLLIKGFSVLISLILVPLTIDYINPTQYGIWLTLSSIIHWFTFLDIGFGNGLRNRFAEAKAQNDIKKAKSLISTTYAVLSIIFITTWLLIVILNNFIEWNTLLGVSKEMESELSRLALIIFSFFCFEMILKIINTIVSADQKTALAGFINLSGQLLVLVIIIIIRNYSKGSLVYLGFALGFSPVFIFIIASIILFNKQYKLFKPSFGSVDFSLTKSIMNIGLKILFNSDISYNSSTIS